MNVEISEEYMRILDQIPERVIREAFYLHDQCGYTAYAISQDVLGLARGKEAVPAFMAALLERGRQLKRIADQKAEEERLAIEDRRERARKVQALLYDDEQAQARAQWCLEQWERGRRLHDIGRVLGLRGREVGRLIGDAVELNAGSTARHRDAFRVVPNS